LVEGRNIFFLTAGIFFLAQDFFSWHKNFFLAVNKDFLLQEKYSCGKKKTVLLQENIVLASEIIS